MLSGALIKNNTLQNMNFSGIHIQAAGNSRFNNIAVENNNVSNIFIGSSGSDRGQGYAFNTSGTSQFTNLSISGNVSSGTEREGFTFVSTESSLLTATLSNNRATGVTNAVGTLVGAGTTAGLTMLAGDASTMSVAVSGMTLTGNAANGVRINDRSSGVLNADFGGGTLGSTGGNRIYGNAGPEIRVDVDGGQLKAENNWWGINTGLSGGETTLEAASTIDSTPFLTADPGI